MRNTNEMIDLGILSVVGSVLLSRILSSRGPYRMMSERLMIAIAITIGNGDLTPRNVIRDPPMRGPTMAAVAHDELNYLTDCDML